MISKLILTASLSLTFPPTAPLTGELFLAPDGNYVGRMMFDDGTLLTLLDGFDGSGAWCADVGHLHGQTYEVTTVCGMGLISDELVGKRLQMYGPGVAINQIMLWSEH
jgi:hypothetical protein